MIMEKTLNRVVAPKRLAELFGVYYFIKNKKDYEDDLNNINLSVILNYINRYESLYFYSFYDSTKSTVTIYSSVDDSRHTVIETIPSYCSIENRKSKIDELGTKITIQILEETLDKLVRIKINQI